MADLKVQQHPDKTFIGRIAKGFDFLGYQFDENGVGIAPKTLARRQAKIAQLYEQGADDERIGIYLRHWERWAMGGMGGRLYDWG